MDKNKSILVVDDNEVNLKILERPLVKEGYNVLLCSKSKKSLDIIRKNNVDLVLLDWVMPEMSGIEICKIVKKDEKLKYTPIIMVTARVESEDLRECLDAGADDYIRKPVDQLEVIARVKASLRTSSLQKDLNRANIKLKKLDKIKDEFLNMASHDLRSPLTSIVTVSDLLLRQPDEEIASRHKDMIGGISKTGKNLINLVGDLLDISKIEEEDFKLNLEKIDLQMFLPNTLQSFEAIADKKGIKLDYQKSDCLPQLSVEVTKIMQVVNNLISNAIKFTDSGGKITLRSQVIEDDFVEIQVEDTGCGIEEKNIPFLFEKFTRLSKPGTGGEKGTGLGLVITKKIVEMHGGRIRVISQKDVGSTFIFSLPIN